MNATLEQQERSKTVKAGDVPGHPFHGNQWTAAEMEQTEPLRKRLMIGDEVIWKEGDQIKHGQMGFRSDQHPEHYEVDEVEVKKGPHPKLENTTLRTLIRTGKQHVIHESTLRMPKRGHGFRSREFVGGASPSRSLLRAIDEELAYRAIIRAFDEAQHPRDNKGRFGTK